MSKFFVQKKGQRHALAKASEIFQAARATAVHSLMEELDLKK